MQDYLSLPCCGRSLCRTTNHHHVSPEYIPGVLSEESFQPWPHTRRLVSSMSSQERTRERHSALQSRGRPPRCREICWNPPRCSHSETLPVSGERKCSPLGKVGNRVKFQILLIYELLYSTLKYIVETLPKPGAGNLH